VAIGDLHGDLAATRAALRLGGAIDGEERWVGGELVVVQTGDQLDRGPDERAILALLERLTLEAEIAGGALHVLNGNHELMNALGDFRYVTPEGFESFADLPDVGGSNPALASLPPAQRPRGAAFLPGGPYAQALARRNTVVIVGDTVFVHGGVLPKHARRIDALNASVRTWLAGGLSDPQPLLAEVMAPDAPVWTRIYSEPTPTTEACAALDEALRLMSAARMVVGHTVQHEGITSACNDKVWRIDVGMAEHYGGSVQVLEIAGNEVRALALRADG
jgi:hypothetical protein